MQQLTRLFKGLFDVRPGEYLTITFMTLYLMCVLFAYYIIKPVSRALFLNNFDIDKLPWLYVLIAAIGGTLAYFYTKVAVRSSLRRAIDFANIFCVGMLVLFWWLIQLKLSWVIYAFNVWVSLFSIMLVSQGWLVAANVYSPREAKRLYGILGVGSVIGAAFGGTFSAFTVYYIGTTNLLLASAGMVILSYVAYRFAIASSKKTLAQAKGAEKEEEFSFGEIVSDIRRHRHLQVIIAIMVITFMVDVMVDFQFSAFAKRAYQGAGSYGVPGQLLRILVEPDHVLPPNVRDDIRRQPLWRRTGAPGDAGSHRMRIPRVADLSLAALHRGDQAH